MINNSVQISKEFVIGGDLRVNRIGYGAMRLTGKPGNFGPYPNWEAGEKLLRHMVNMGVNFIDTAEAYGPGFNEEIISSALYPYASDVAIATKGGINKPASNQILADASPENLRRGCEASLKRLRVEQIDLYQLHRPDPKIPFYKSVEMLATLKKEGKIRHIGLCNVNMAQIKEALMIVPISSIQNRYNIVERSSENILDFCTENAIAFIPYGSLGAHPLKQGAPLASGNDVITEIANKYRVKSIQVVLAWLLHRAHNIILIPGTTQIEHMEENIAASNIQLTSSEFEALNLMQTA